MKKTLSILFAVVFSVIAISVASISVNAAESVATPEISRFENVTNGVKIYWDKVSDASQYRVFYKGKSGWKVLGTTKNTSIVDEDVKSGSTYTYTICCLDSKGKVVSEQNETGWKQKFVAAPKISKISSADGGVRIEWNSVKGADKYMVMYNGKNGWRSMEESDTTSILDKDVKSDKNYTYSVRCLDKDGNAISGYYTSGWTVHYIATPQITRFENKSSGIKIYWDKVQGAAQYRVFYKGKEDWKRLATTSGTSVLDDDVKSGNSYTYTVRCLDKNGNYISSFSSKGWKQKFVAAPSIKSIYSANGGVKIEWNSVKGADKYMVMYNGKNGWRSMEESGTTSLLDRDVKSDKNYTYSVRCLDKDGNAISDYNTKGWTVHYIAAPQVTKLKSTPEGVKISWDSVKGAAKYKVFYKGKKDWNSMGTTTSTSFVDEDVRSGNSYTYTVRCLDENGSYISSYNSAGWKYTYKNPTVSAPEIQSLECESYGINIKWSKVDGAASYRLFVYDDASWSAVATTNSTEYTDEENLSQSNLYSLRCLDADGDYISDYSKGDVKIKFHFPATMKSVKERTDGVRVDWKGEDGVKYRVFVKTESTDWKAIADTSSSSYTHTGLEPNTCYTYAVRMISNDSKQYISGLSNTISYTYKAENTYRDEFITYLAGHTDEWVPSSGAADNIYFTFIDFDFDGREELLVSYLSYDNSNKKALSSVYRFENGALTSVKLPIDLETDVTAIHNPNSGKNELHSVDDFNISDKYGYVYYKFSNENNVLSQQAYVVAALDDKTGKLSYYKSPVYIDGKLTSPGTEISESEYNSIAARYYPENAILLALSYQKFSLADWQKLNEKYYAQTLTDIYNGFNA